MVKITDKLLTKQGSLSLLDFFQALQRRFPEGWIPAQASAFLEDHYGGTEYIDIGEAQRGVHRYNSMTLISCYQAGILRRAPINDGSEAYYGRGKRYRYSLNIGELLPDPTSVEQLQKRVLTDSTEGGRESLVKKLIIDGRLLSWVSKVKQADPIAYKQGYGPFLDTLLERN